MSKVGIISLGCPRNLIDSEVILGRLKQKKCCISDIEDCDVAIVNTCAFIKEACEESVETILELIDLKKEKKIKKIVVAGCLTQRYGKDLIPELKEVDAFIGNISLDNGLKSVKLTPRHFAYVKISEGCINKCSFCVIPKIKGSLKSRSIESIVKEVKNLDKKGVKEINLVGQDATSYGLDRYNRFRIVDLLRQILANTKGIHWIRLLYTHPNHISDELIDLIAQENRICKYIDLPVQHINDRILKLMQRNITKNEIISSINKIRKNIPDVIIRTSLIVGFPSETDDEFLELIEFIEEIKFERLGVFIYSQEEETPAFDFEGQIPEKLKRERFDIIMQKQQLISDEIQRKFLDEELEVLVDEIDPNEKDSYLCRSFSDAPEVDGCVFVQTKNKLTPGDFIKVKIKDTLEYDLVGELL